MTSVSFVNVLQFFMYRTLISFIKFNLLFVFAAIVNGIAFLISLSNFLLSVYRHRFLYISFVSCNFTELSFLISLCVCMCVCVCVCVCGSFMEKSFCGIFIYNILSASSDSFIYFLSDCCD